MPVAAEPAAAEIRHVVPAGRGWSAVIGKGAVLTITDLHGEQAVDALIFCAGDPSERYDAPLTVLAQRAPVLSRGARLLSNRGAVLMTIVEDSFGAHDTLVGCCSGESNAVRFGEETRHLPSCRDNFLLELARYGMGKRDIVGNINFFMRVAIAEDGALAIVEGRPEPGHEVALRAEQDVLVVLSNCPQINNPANGFHPTPIAVAIRPPSRRRGSVRRAGPDQSKRISATA